MAAAWHIAGCNQCPRSATAPPHYSITAFALAASRADLLVSADAPIGCLHTGNASKCGRLGRRGRAGRFVFLSSCLLDLLRKTEISQGGVYNNILGFTLTHILHISLLSVNSQIFQLLMCEGPRYHIVHREKLFLRT